MVEMVDLQPILESLTKSDRPKLGFILKSPNECVAQLGRARSQQQSRFGLGLSIAKHRRKVRAAISLSKAKPVKAASSPFGCEVDKIANGNHRKPME